MTKEDAELDVDSAKGIAVLMRWARDNGFVLYPYHRRIAAQHKVSVEGVRFSDPLPQ